MKRCSKCLEELEENCFNYRKGGSQLQPWCKKCQKEASKAYRENNKEKCNKNLNDWRKRNSSKKDSSFDGR